MTIVRIVLSLLCGMCLGTSLLQAQADFRSQNIPKAGSSYSLRFCDTNGVSIQPGGANQTWDYSTLVPQPRRTTISYVLPTQTPYAAQFPSANLVLRNDSSFVFWRVNPNSITTFGTVFRDNSRELLLADPYDLGPMPIKYFQNRKDEFRGSFVRVTPPTTVTRGGSGEFNYDGYGTLILPSGITIKNIMRLVSTQTTADTSRSGALKTVGTTKIITTQWMGADSTVPSLVITDIENTFAINEQVVSTKRSRVVQYDDRRPGGATSVYDDEGIQISLMPNPTSGQSILHYSLQKPSVLRIEVFDVLGNIIWQQQTEKDAGEHSLPLDVQNIADGIYYVRLRTGEQTQAVIPLRVLR